MIQHCFDSKVSFLLLKLVPPVTSMAHFPHRVVSGARDLPDPPISPSLFQFICTSMVLSVHRYIKPFTVLCLSRSNYFILRMQLPGNHTAQIAHVPLHPHQHPQLRRWAQNGLHVDVPIENLRVG